MADKGKFNPAVVSDDVATLQVYETNLATGEVIELLRQVDITNGSVSYVNASTGAAVVPTGAVQRTPVRVSLGRETISPDDSTVTTLTVPANVQRAEVHVWSASALWSVDGTDPDGATYIGSRSADGDSFELEGADELANFKALALNAGETANLHVEYFNGEDPAFI